MEIGIIGLGDMGKMYAREFSRAGYKVNGCDLTEKRSELERELSGTGINILDDGVAVSRKSDLIIYSVEAENIESVVKRYGSSTKLGAIVAGQTSVKTPEIEAFEKYLPKDTHIVTCHSLHGHSISPKNQNLVVINHRSKPEFYQRALETFSKLGSNLVEISDFREHDRITADTQAVTHIAFESMGTAWKNAGFYPWENSSYLESIDNVKILLMLRIYSGKSHIYASLAMLNPYAKEQIKQYAKSESELFKLMISGRSEEFKGRINEAVKSVFGNGDSHINLDEEIVRQFGLGGLDTFSTESRKPNSHLSYLAMIDAWHNLGINPYKHRICETPLFKLRLGSVEYLFRNKRLLEESLQTALYDRSIRGDDLEFHSSVREWASIVEHGDLQAYKKQFEDTKSFFKDRIAEGMQKSNELIAKLVKN